LLEIYNEKEITVEGITKPDLENPGKGLFNLSSAELYDVATTIVGKVDNRKKYIQETLIPRMDEHRRRFRPQTGDETLKKLLSADVSKPGEAVEIIEEAAELKRN